jgi:hypothetical protein
MVALEPQLQQTQQVTVDDDYDLSGDVSTVERKRRFLSEYRSHGVIYRAAQATGIHRTTVYKWLESDPVFVQAFADCHEDTYDDLEASGFEKAMAGDPILTMFYLKAHRPKFRDKMQVDLQLVDSEIQERMQQLNLRQLPAATTGFIEAEGYGVDGGETKQVSHQPRDQQKEDEQG